jgi:hypothetical protein
MDAMTVAESDATTDFITYGEWGTAFFETAITEERILGAVASMIGRPIDFGPLKIDPIGLVKVTAHGSIGEPAVARRDDALVAYDLVIPVRLAMELDMSLDKHRFNADVHVRLTLTARAARPLKIVIDIEPPTKRNVRVDMKAEALRSSMLQWFAGIDGEVRRFVAKFVRREIEKPEIVAARTIDVAGVLAHIATPR